MRYGGENRNALWYVILVITTGLVAASCGGSDATSDVANAAVSATDPTSDEPPPPDLEFLGSLAEPNPRPTSVSLGAEGGSFDVGAATVMVPAGALSETVLFSSTVAELDFSATVTPPFGGTVYSISTADDVELTEPVVIEVPAPSDSVIVNQRVDGEWASVQVPAGPTTKLNIEHFSEITTTIIEKPAPDASVTAPPDGDEFVPAVYLEACLVMFSDGAVVGPDEVILQLGYAICTQSLIDSLTPLGASKVPARCVGDKISPAVDIRAAIAQCVDENEQGPEDESTDESAGSGESDDTTESDAAGSGESDDTSESDAAGAGDSGGSRADDSSVSSGSGGFLPNPLIPGPDGTVRRQSIVLTIGEGSATLDLDVAWRAGVSYVEGEVVCSEDFVYRTVDSDLTVVDGTVETVEGTVEVIFDLDSRQTCDTEQSGIGVPTPVEVSGRIDGDTFNGTLSFADIELSFTAVVVRN